MKEQSLFYFCVSSLSGNVRCWLGNIFLPVTRKEQRLWWQLQNSFCYCFLC